MVSVLDAKPAIEQALAAALGNDGVLNDLTSVEPGSVSNQAALAPFRAFSYRLYSSAAATTALRELLRCHLPGSTSSSYEDAVSAIARNGHHCYLVGGQVRDILRGVVSTDVDFNYSCSAREVALVTVANDWPTKFKCVGDTTVPNYVLIGDESSEEYLEGFSIDFNATKACYMMDFRMNMCLYDLTNDVIIDKTGFGVADIRAAELRLPCVAGETFEMWASATITQGLKELRFLKFVLRAQAKGAPLATDAAECEFVVQSLRRALSSNADALRGFWFGYALGAQLKTPAGVAMLRDWVVHRGGPSWWAEAWEPLVRGCVPATSLEGGGGSPKTPAPHAWPRYWRRYWRRWALRRPAPVSFPAPVRV